MAVKSGIGLVASLFVLAFLSGCRSDGDDRAFAKVADAITGGQQAPVISGSPKTTVTIGEKYAFRPRAHSPENAPLRFGIDNQPRWSRFDDATGQLSGEPTATDVGTYPDVKISVTDGASTESLPPFDIKVVEAATTPDPTPPTTPPPAWTPEPGPSAGSAFEFSEIPEIVFVRGYAETEHMGIFQLDTQNRWTPGDLDNSSGWKPRIQTQLVTESGSVTGVSYDPATGVLSYDGSGSGSETATVYLTAPTQSARSAAFNVRVLQPTMVWGVDAARRFPGVGLDSASVPFSEMQKQLRARATYDAPNVLLIAKGTYEDEFYIGPEKLHLYLLGEPTQRPVLRNGQIGLIKFETAYLKNLDLWNTSVGGGGYLVDRKVNLYATKIYQHDSTREGNGFASPNYEGNSAYGIVLPPGEWRHWMWNFHGSQMGGKGNTTHQFYIEGRPNTYLLINNIRISGTRRCSAIKSTRFHNVIRNSYLSALQDPAQPALGLRAEKLIDIVSVGETVVYNNEFIGAWNDTQSGVNSAMVHFRARRDWWSSDSPAYPDVSYSPARTSLVNGGYLAPPGFPAGPETFVNPAFWEKVRSYDMSDPKNPYSFKKYIAYNTFRWLDEGFKRGSPLRDDGTSPRSPVAQFSIDEYWGTVPANWAERSVTFAANNRYIGWSAEDTTNSSRWIDMVWSPPESQVTLVGPGPWAYPAPPRAMVDVGGDSGPTGSNAPVVLPDWFRK